MSSSSAETSTRPGDMLQPPVARDQIPDAINEYLIHPADFLSPTHDVLWLLGKAGLDNPYEAFAKNFVGDWERVQESADALTNLGRFCQAAANQVRADQQALQANWSGQAAADAYGYLLNLISALQALVPQFDEASVGYNSTATGIASLGNLVVSALEEISDYAGVAAIAAAAGTALSETVIGGIIGGTAAAAAIARVASLVADVFEWIGRAVTLVDAIGGTVASLMGAIDAFTATSLPAAYQFTGNLAAGR